MVSVAFFFAVYSYTIFALGLLHILYRELVLVISIFYFVLFSFFFRYKLKSFFLDLVSKLKLRKISLELSSFLILILFLQGLVNFIGALGPELAFDALWYHLTLPKIYLQDHAIYFLKGGLFYYSTMPKLVEMIYVGALAIGSEIIAKVIHFLFGILTILVLYRFSRKFVSKTLSLIVCCIFYANLVVGWQSITAYVDLGRTFFETLSIFMLFKFFEKEEFEYFVLSSIMLGLAITSKLLSVGSIIIFATLLFFYYYEKKDYKRWIKYLGIFLGVCLLFPLAYFIFSFVNTNNPFYPIFSSIYPVQLSISLSPFAIIKDLILVFLRSSDPISPIYLISLPLIIVYFKKFDFLEKLLVYYSILAVLIWYLTPNTGGGRFIMPYLPVLSLACGVTMSKLRNIKVINFLLGIIIFVSLVSIVYRGFANARYLPVIFGFQSKNDFLVSNLNFSFGDFYDVDGSIKQITDGKTILVYGFHNLYYMPSPFIHESYVEKGDTFFYILTKDSLPPARFSYWDLVYQNGLTGARLYAIEGQKWIY